jgi:hypothetical protein
MQASLPGPRSAAPSMLLPCPRSASSTLISEHHRSFTTTCFHGMQLRTMNSLFHCVPLHISAHMESQSATLALLRCTTTVCPHVCAHMPSISVTLCTAAPPLQSTQLDPSPCGCFDDTPTPHPLRLMAVLRWTRRAWARSLATS